MINPSNYIKEVAQVTKALRNIGFNPILVGGMALVILGSKRVTADFDFLISQEAREQNELLDILYNNGFELVSQLNKKGEIIATLESKKVAGIRLKLDAPASAYFLNHQTGLRIDFLFDFPLLASEVELNAEKKKISSSIFYVASKKDLIKLKKIAYKNRSLSTDLQDLEFLSQN